MELTQAQAFGLLVFYCIIYVLPLHASPSTRPTVNRSRDDPSTIRARIRAVTLSTTLCSLCTLLLLHSTAHDAHKPLSLMGYWPVGLLPTVKALSLTMLLFAAPLYEALWLDGVWQDWARLQPLKDLWTHWPQWRNYIAGPITEECLFRSAGVPLLLIAGTPVTRIILLSPVVFGLAHIHHFYEFRISNPQVSLPMAIARTVLQFSYTSLFGMYGTFLFLRTGSLLAVIVVHAFCNTMGLPRVWGRVEPWWMSPQDIEGPAGTRWTIGYYVLLFGGMFAWYQGFWPLTGNSVALTEF